ncbi:helicase HerA-like domain-containing protein [Microbacterium sp. CFBP9034]|uniref:helicase HerA-like domain-containing protein n=1 Tax=Microbacterium sp. CFBP9034 TaxID=3096540 RepID=UPI002A6A5B81|nr:helicase HerA-like domain-containing protein [Microbacterium sp. CFBP9034]MDY0910622.1 helicase HerA-like domain-containing protein [Microbacterium sp. CFBP9034]
MTAPETPDPAVAAAEAELARLTAEAEAAEAQLRAAQARAALATAQAEAAKAKAGGAGSGDDGPAPDAHLAEAPIAPAPATEAREAEAPAVAPAAPLPAEAPATASGPLDDDAVAAIVKGYTFEAETLDLGALLNGDPVPSAQVRIPLGMMNRHGLVAGATGTGKTRTLQGLAEQLAAKGVPVFAADIKGDLSGVATPGEANEKLLARTRGIGQDWKAEASVTDYFALGGIGKGVPVRATVSGFGPLLLSKVLGLNETQESSLGLVFHYADQQGLALVDLADLRAVLTYLTGDEGKAELKELGGLSAATAGVILRELITFADEGADVFFGEPEFEVGDFLRTASDGRGVISLLEVPGVVDKPALFSTFLMYLLAELFEILPEVGDLDKPKLVFFFDEAHLLFKDASKDFLSAIVQTVRLIRSKGVGVFFVTQTPKDVPSDVLAQLGSRVQHALRAFTPDDAKALRATVGTYPKSGYDLERVLQELGTGEAIVTVMSEKGAPTPVAWTRLRAPQGLMSPTPDPQIEATVKASPLLAKYGTAIDRESAREILTAKMKAADDAAAAADAALAKAKADAEYAKQQAAIDKAKAAEDRKAQQEYDRLLKKTQGTTRTSRSAQKSPIEQILGSKATQTILGGVIRGIFGTGRR